MPERCLVQECVPVRVNCNTCVVDTNCYINYDPIIHNLRKIYRSYEDRSKNVRTAAPGCTAAAIYYEDYKIAFAGFITHGGCPKKTSIKFYNVDSINELFTSSYVVKDSTGRERIICDDTCGFRVCQPHNVPANSKFRLFVIFEYKYDICDTVADQDTPPKYDLYVADLPNVNCHFQEQCRVPQLNLQLVASVDTKNACLPSDKEDLNLCYLCVANDELCAPCNRGLSHVKAGEEGTLIEPFNVLSLLLSKITL